MTSERRLWLVRHGETEGQSSIRYHGSNDVPLSDLGRRQIKDLLPLLQGVAFSRVWHSPLQRAAESATLLVDGLELSNELLAADDRLREICFGACEGMTREEIDAAYPTFWADYEGGRLDAFPEGEPRAEFAARVAAASREVVAGEWTGDMLLVAHRGIVKHAVRTLLQADDAPQQAFGVELASLTVLRQAGGAWQLDLLGMRP